MGCHSSNRRLLSATVISDEVTQPDTVLIFPTAMLFSKTPDGGIICMEDDTIRGKGHYHGTWVHIQLYITNHLNTYLNTCLSLTTTQATCFQPEVVTKVAYHTQKHDLYNVIYTIIFITCSLCFTTFSHLQLSPFQTIQQYRLQTISYLIYCFCGFKATSEVA